MSQQKPGPVLIFLLGLLVGVPVGAVVGHMVYLAMVVVPQITGPSHNARLSSLTSDLSTVRGQLELYKVQHLDKYPALANFDAQMVGTTDIDGGPAGADFGPYLARMPANPFSGGSRVGNGPVGSSDGFYDEATGEFRANDSTDHASY